MFFSDALSEKRWLHTWRFDFELINPLSPSFQIQTLQTDLHTFPGRTG